MKKRLPVWAGFALLSVTPNLVQAEQVYLSEIHYNPKGSAPEYLELTNASATVLDLAEWEFTQGIDYVFPEYSDADAEASFLKAWERIVISPLDEASFRASYPGIPADVRVFGPWSGNLSNSGERITLKDKNGILLTTVDYRDGGRKWPVAADGVGHSLRIKSLLGRADDWRNWETSLGIGGTPGTEPQTGSGRPTASPEIDLGERFPVAGYAASWKYHDLTAEPPADWNSALFNDGGWPEHPGMFGFDSSRALPEPGLWEAPAGEVNWRRDSLGGLVTWYARKAFEFNGETAGARLLIEGFLDDGAVFYLNGQEVERVRIGAGPVDWQTLADRATENTTAELLVSKDVSGMLVPGVNVLAVEVHNESTGSSDVVFGATVKVLRGGGDLVINEVSPGAAGSGFVEVYNGSGAEVDLGGYFLSDDPENLTKTAIGAGTLVPSGGYATLGFVESGLSAGGEVFLTHPDGLTVLEGISLASVAAGESIGRKPSGGAEWFVFNGGTPGGGNGGAGDLVGMLGLSEVHFDGAGNIDWVEAFAVESSVDTGGLFLATEKDLSDRVPLGGIVPGRGYASWDVSFPVGGGGQVTLFLVSDGGVVIASAEMDRDAGEESFQVFPPSSGEWYGSAGHTRDAANAPDRQTDVVINEIMCDPPSDSRNGEFVELYNRGSVAVDVSGWQFVDGIGYEFPGGTSIPAGGYLVVAANAGWIKSVYGNVTVVGDYSGNLSNGGELLRLEDANGELVDEVDYKTGGDWPSLANGDGSSLELVHPDSDNDLPTAWRDSDESSKSSFESFEFTGRYSDLADERTGGATDYKELHLHLVGDAHVVLKNIRLERGGTNLLQNAAQDTTNGSGRSGWLTQGTHHASHHQGGEFHLISDGHGDNRANRAEIDCTAMNRNDTLTLKFDGRWVNGKPTMVAQTFDHSFAKVAHFDVPDNLGTPGAVNSRVLPSAPPVAASLKHEPVVPSASDNVEVTAKVSLPASGGTVELRYRADNSAGDGDWSTAAMNDSGQNGDAVAGDGIWSGRITDMRVDRRVVQFYVSAKSPGGAEVTLPAGGAERPAMYIVDSRTPNTDLKTVRWVVAAYDRGAWANGQRARPYNFKFPKLSNSYKNMTLIVNESEAIYNAEVRPSGSPWHTGQRANLNLRGKFRMPNDHLMHGLSKYAFDNTLGAEGAGALYNNKLPRYWLYLMGHEHNESEFITVIDGTTQRDAVEIFEPIGNDLLERNFGNDGPQGELYRIDDIFRFSDSDINGTSKSQITDRFWWYAGDQWEGPGRYHTQWLLRSNEADYDYSTLVNMLQTVSRNRYSQAEIERLIDQRRCALMMAVRGYLGDWDNITLNRPKNSFFYRPPGDGKFHFFHHDSDLGFQGNHANDPLVATHGNNREIRNWVRKPYNERVFRYYLNELKEKYSMGSTRVDTWFALEDAASREFRPNSYRSFFTSRNRGSQLVGRRTGELSSNVDVPVTVNPVADTGADTISLTGTAGYRVWEVVVEGHPEAEFRWTSDRAWRIDGIVLTSGANPLNLIGVDDDGKPVFGAGGEDDPLVASLEVTKTGDGTPIAELETDPKAGRLSVASVLELDARDSVDPEGEAVSFTWNTPATGLAGFVDEGDGRAAATFEVPGLYDFGVSVSDGAGPTASASREIAVYGPGGFSTFGDTVLEGFWSEANIQALDNSGVGSWYSLEAESGRLTMFLSGDAALPLSSGASFNHPWISRALPASGDWVLETELEVVGAQFVDFMTGLMVSVASGGNETRYAWGYREGNKVDLVRITSSGAQTTLSTVAFSDSDDVVLRIRRAGANLLFDWRHDETDWMNVEQVSIGAGATAEKGGIFTSTAAAETVRVAFDYVMLIDPVQFSPFRGQVVLSEIMYKPDGGSAYEFLELHNTTDQPISLNGFNFPQGEPFDAFSIGAATLPAGGYRVLVANLDAFTERYGAGAVGDVIGIWPNGSLSNGGEKITLLDANGLIVVAMEYSDSGEWPAAADDAGASLVLKAGATNPASPGSWSASMFAGGSPGGRDGESLAEWQARTGSADLLADTDENGVNALLTFALGLDLAAGGLAEALPRVGTTEVGGKTYATLTFRRRIGSESEGLTYAVEVAQGLSGWSSAPGSTVEVGNPDYVGDGTEEVTVRSSVALEDGLDAAQMRLRVSIN